MKKMGNPTTIGELKEIIKNIPDNTEFYVDGSQGYLYHYPEKNFVVADTNGFLDE